MDVEQIRQMFLGTPRSFSTSCPLAPWDNPACLDPQSCAPYKQDYLSPIGTTSGLTWRYNLDGFLTFEMTGSGTDIPTYIQSFRNGAIEAVCSHLLGL